MLLNDNSPRIKESSVHSAKQNSDPMPTQPGSVSRKRARLLKKIIYAFGTERGFRKLKIVVLNLFRLADLIIVKLFGLTLLIVLLYQLLKKIFGW